MAMGVDDESYGWKKAFYGVEVVSKFPRRVVRPTFNKVKVERLSQRARRTSLGCNYMLAYFYYVHLAKI